jgi:serine/threonine protein kinase/tetratricopeptide (TPR) repeat protein
MSQEGQGSSRTDLGEKDQALPGVTPERWQKIKELFLAASERSPKDRAGFLNQACGADESLRAEVESLLAAESKPPESALLNTSAMRPLAAQVMPDLMVGRRAGAYQLVQRIGAGGMAAVYLAVRADDHYQKQVAVKVVRPQSTSEELLNRFRNERQTLAGLDHPNIVKLLDGGNTDEGLPYLVMDYVEGVPIDNYADAHKLSIEDRVRLFCRVCEAVQYAHQHQIIHRDLKPSNILVTPDGTPKLLDFGIAKVFDPHTPAQTLVVTQTGTRRMTPAFASPEQVRGEVVTAATDIYSLGVVLYELLTGRRPYKLRQSTPAEIERAICEEEPEKLSTAIDRVETVTAADGTTSTTITPELVSQTREGEPEKLRRRLRGDLDKVVLMALEKEPRRRYASVKELADDLQRHLDHLPVRARPSTLTYRASKFVSRRKTEVVSGISIVLILLGAIVLNAWQSRRALEKARAALIAQRSGSRPSVAVLGFKNLSGRSETTWVSTALSEMLTTELAAGGKLRMISGENVAQMRVNLSLPDLDSFAAGTLRRVNSNLGSDFVVLGSYLDIADSSRSLRVDFRLQDTATGETITAVAESGSETALPDLVTRAGADLRQKLGISAISPAESAGVQASLPSNSEAARLYAEGLAKLRVYDALGARELLEQAVSADPSFALAHSALGEAWSNLGYQRRAADEARKARELAGDLSREQHLWVEARYDESSETWDKAIDVFHTLFNFFPDNLDYGLHLAKAEIEAGKLDESQRTIDALRKTALGEHDPRVDITQADVDQYRPDYKHELEVAVQAQKKAEGMGARLLLAQALYIQSHAMRLLGDPHKSIALASEARQIFASAGDHYREAHVLIAIGNASIGADDLAGAEKAYKEAMETYHKIGNKSDESSSLMALGTVHLFQRDFAGAVDAYEKSLAIARELGDTARAAIVLHNLGLAEKDEGHLARARQDLEEALPVAQRNADKGLIAGCLINLAHVVAAQGDLPRAKKLANNSIGERRDASSKPRLGEVIVEAADIDLIGGDIKAAEALYSEGLQIFTEAKQDFYASSALFGLGEVLMVSGDLSGARKKHEAALASREKEHGSVRELFDSRIRIAEVSLEQGHPSDAEAGVRQALKEYAAEDEPAARVEADVVLARSLIAQGKLSQAEEVVSNDRKLMAQSEDWMSRISIDILNSQLLTTSGNPEQAINQLQTSLQKSKKSGFGQLEFEARLALGEAEIKGGKATVGRADLRALERDAKAKGYMLIARKAGAAAKATKRDATILQ